GQDPQPPGHQPGPGLCLRVHRTPRPEPAHGQPPPQETDGRGSARPGAARHLGLLLAAPGRPGRPGRRPRPPRSQSMTTSQTDQDALREQVRALYAAAATKVTADAGDCGCGQPADCGCGDGCCSGAATAEEPGFGAELYAALDRDQLPDTALLASLGCGNPSAVAELGE